MDVLRLLIERVHHRKKNVKAVEQPFHESKCETGIARSNGGFCPYVELVEEVRVEDDGNDSCQRGVHHGRQHHEISD